MVPLPEFLVEESVGKSFAANANTFQNTIAAQLVQHQLSVNHTRTLHLIGDDATHKMRICVPQIGH